MKRLCIITFLLLLLFNTVAFATSGSLDDVISNNTEVNSNTDESVENNVTNSREENNRNFIEGLNQAADLATADVEGVSGITAGMRNIAAWIVQVLAYGITVFLGASILLDLTYIALPPLRSILANGHQGAAGTGTQSMMPGTMGNIGGMAGFGNRYNNMSGYGTINGMQNNNMMNQGGTRLGSLQLVSNAALNAVAQETTVGPDGKTNGPFKIYCKEMVIMLIIVPVLITLAVTGSLTSLGFAIANALVEIIAGIDI